MIQFVESNSNNKITDLPNFVPSAPPGKGSRILLSSNPSFDCASCEDWIFTAGVEKIGGIFAPTVAGGHMKFWKGWK